MIDRWAKEAMKDPQTVGNPRDLNEKAIQMDLQTLLQFNPENCLKNSKSPLCAAHSGLFQFEKKREAM